MAEETWC